MISIDVIYKQVTFNIYLIVLYKCCANTFNVLGLFFLFMIFFSLIYTCVAYVRIIMKANSASGMAVNDECKLKFMELKAKRNFRFIIFKIDENIQQVVVDKLGQPDESYEDFTLAFPANECRYAVFDFDFITDEHCQKSKIFFISW